MQTTIEIHGISYVTARDIEAYYKLTRKRAWQELQKAKLSYVKLLQTHFYPVDEARGYFDQFVIANPRFNKIGLTV
ncbi:hypothetical protein [Hymenobacter sp. B1770]|uniref:hypothetical protein n=1 Tax=Hymenobacter sp. B1770 TaxID=1718788 RepID=UPI003CF2D608